MRLIDADELKKAYFNAIEKSSIGEISIIDIIDNAPTVEPNLSEVYQEGYYDGHIDGYTKAINEERPQGEYIDGTRGHYCSLCYEIDYAYYDHKFCPYCGADMRPKPNHLRDCENCVHHSENGCEVWECEFEKRSDV